MWIVTQLDDFSFEEGDKVDNNVFYIKWGNTLFHCTDFCYYAYITLDDQTDIPIYLSVGENYNLSEIETGLDDGEYFHHSTSYIRDGMFSVGKVGDPIFNEIDLSEMTWNAVRRVNNQ